MKYCLLLVLCVIACSGSLRAQSPALARPVTVRLDSAGIRQLTDTLEKQTGVYFYYDVTAFDNTYFTATLVQQPMRDVLDSLLGRLGFSVTEDAQRHVFIVAGPALTLQIPVAGKATAPVLAVTPHANGRVLPRSSKRKLPGVAATEDENAAVKASYDDFKTYNIGNSSTTAGNATITGYIRRATTNEGVGNATVAVQGLTVKAISDPYGYYTITLPKGSYVLRVTCIGMMDARRQVSLHGDGKLPVVMHDFVQSLKGVTIEGEKSSNVRSTAMGVQKIDIQTIKRVPSPMGEADILRVLQMLPGVTSAGEGSTGLNVRGGNVDQTLVLLDGATVYNPAHFFGFFSAFNPDVIKDAELYKSSIPVRYGSRLSSVLDVITREGNQHKFSGSGGIGPLNGHLTLEGPIGNKTTFILGGRASYSDWILHLLKDPQYKRSSAGFYDGNLKITNSWNDHNTLYLSAYISNDNFKLDGDTAYKYGNKNAVLRWKHIFSSKAYGTFSVGTDNYNFNMNSDANEVTAFKYRFNVAQQHANVDMNFMPSNKHHLEAGLGGIYYQLSPGDYQPSGKSLARPNTVPDEQALEASAYVADNYTVTPDLSLSVGLRGAMFSNRGPGIVNEYTPGLARETSSVTDSITYGAGKNIKTYAGLEPRMALRYTLTANSSVKAAYNRTQQFIHMLSNTTVVSPTDVWKLSDTYIQPEVGDQVSIGYYQNFKHNTIETSAELYYKWIRHALSYKSGANLLLNHHVETDVANADGKAYGVELLVKKTAGKMTGWVSYTYSRTLLRMRDPLVTDPTNHGNYYPADYDKPHTANLVINYSLSHRFNVSLTSVYATGRPITLPVASYYIDGSPRVLYADRNSARIPDYFRSDFSVNIDGNHKLHKLAHSSWSLGLYNMLARRNAYSVYFVSENGQVHGYKLSIFGTAIPFITYNFKF